MKIYPTSLCFLTTRKCTAACKNCCFGCSPQGKGFIPTETMARLIGEAADVPSIRTIVFSGGECFLLGKDLNRLVSIATKAGLTTRFVSNGYWASTQKIAEEKINDLVSNGLTEANFSTGDDHCKFVPIENIVNGALACVKANILVCVMLELHSETHFPINKLLHNQDFKKAVELGKILLLPSAWVGFNPESHINYPKKIQENPKIEACTSLLRDISININGDILLCCGLSQDYIKGFSVGNVFSSSKTLKQHLSNVPPDFIKIWLNVCGPKSILKYASKFMPEFEEICSSVVHRCEFCKILYQNQRIQDIILSNIPQYSERIIEQFHLNNVMDVLNTRTAFRCHKKERKTDINELLNYFTNKE